MTGSPPLFYLLAAGVVISVILSTAVSKGRLALISTILAITFCWWILRLANLSSVGLILFVMLSAVQFWLSFRKTQPNQEPFPFNPKTILLTWIVLGSLLLIFAAVLKNTRWQALRLESLPDWSETWSQYGILLILVGLTILASLLWHKTNRAN